ncbi:MAG: TVP38/TMEM64 family protein [Rhodospirillales bacterium]|nr:TVP38/TMEM64 family protein [Rhodospirillales bacterium]
MTTTIDRNACRPSSGSQPPAFIARAPSQSDDASHVGEQNHGRIEGWSTRRRHLRAATATTVTLAIAGCVALGLFIIDKMEGEISVTAFEDVILSWGHWGVLASVGLMVLHSFVPFPAELVAVANGMLYGPFWGTIITWVGAMLGAFLAFALARAFGRPFVEAMVARRHWQRLDDWTGAHAAQMVFLARFLPVISFNLVNYAAGLTRISWWSFGWTTGLGILPMTILMAAMGDQAGRMPWHWWLALLAVTGLGWLVIQRWLHRRTVKRAAAPQTEDPGHSEDSGLKPTAGTQLGRTTASTSRTTD